MYLTCLNCLNYVGVNNGGRGNHHKSNPNKSDFGGFFYHKRGLEHIHRRSQRQTEKSTEEKSATESYDPRCPRIWLFG